MSKTKKRFSIIILSILAMLCAFTFIFANVDFSANAETPESFKMIDGAWIRVDSHKGIRFGAEISKTDAETVMNDQTKEFGALIVRKAVLDNFSITDNYVPALKTALEGTSHTIDEYIHKDLTVATNYFEDTTKYAVFCSVTDLKYNKINSEFFGIIYIKTTAQGGGVTYDYASFNTGENVRTAANVAFEAYKVEGGQAANAGIYKEYMIKGNILNNNAGISEENLNSSYNTTIADTNATNAAINAYYAVEAAPVNSLIGELPSAPTKEQGVQVYEAKAAYEALSAGSKALVDTTALNASLSYYDARWIMATDIVNVDAFANRLADEYDHCKANVAITKNTDAVYGATQNVTVTVGTLGDEEQNTHYAFKFKDFSAIKSAVTNDTVLKFYVKANAITTITFAGTTAKNVDVLSIDTWQEVTFTASEVAALNGFVWKAYAAPLNLEFSNFYVFKAQAQKENVEALVAALPEASNVDILDGENIYNAYGANAALPSGTTIDGTLATKLESVYNYYDLRWKLLTNNGVVHTFKNKSSSEQSSYVANVAISNENDLAYGTTQYIDITKNTANSGAGSNYAFKFADLASIQTAVSNVGTDALLVFYVKANKTTTIELTAGTTKNVEITSADTWQEVTLTASEVSGLTGFIRKDWAAPLTLEISNLYAATLFGQTENAVNAINALPEASAVEMLDGEAINNAYNEYTAITEKGLTIDSTLVDKLTAVKEAYDARWIMVTDTATRNTFVNKVGAEQDSYRADVVISTSNTPNYGTTQLMTITKNTANGDNGSHYAFKFADLGSIQTAVSNAGADASLVFYVKANKTTTIELTAGTTKNVEITSADTWQEVTLTASEVSGLTGFIRKDWAAPLTLEIGNFYVVKAQG